MCLKRGFCHLWFDLGYFCLLLSASPFPLPHSRLTAMFSTAKFALILALGLHSSPVLALGHEPLGMENIFKPKCLIKRHRAINFNLDESLPKAPWATIDLDLPPDQRFAQVYRPYSDKIQQIVAIVKSLAKSIVHQAGVDLFEALMGQVHAKLFPSPYKEEIEGISAATNVPIGDLTALNLFYEMAHLCTSIVAENGEGRLVHGRNLDFGIMLGWDWQGHDWLLTEHLRGLTLNLNFTRHGRALFYGTTFAGHLGLVTGMRPFGYSVSINSQLRHDWAPLLRWLGQVLRPSPPSKPAPKLILWAMRELLEGQADFQAARQFLSAVPLLTGCFFVLGGNRADQGLMLHRNETGVLEQRELGQENWFVLQRNSVPFLDSLAGTEKCMQRLGEYRVDWLGLLTVLSSKNTLNKSTVHSTMMLVQSGRYETFLQNCTDPCWFI